MARIKADKGGGRGDELSPLARMTDAERQEYLKDKNDVSLKERIQKQQERDSMKANAEYLDEMPAKWDDSKIKGQGPVMPSRYGQQLENNKPLQETIGELDNKAVPETLSDKVASMDDKPADIGVIQSLKAKSKPAATPAAAEGQPTSPLAAADNSIQTMSQATESMSGVSKQLATRQLSSLQELKDKLEARYQADTADVRVQQLAERFAHALTQLGAGLAGLKSGVDMSSLKFDKQDFNKDLDRLLAKYSTDLASLEKGADRDIQQSQFETTTELQKAGLKQNQSQHEDKMKFDREKMNFEKLAKEHDRMLAQKYEDDKNKRITSINLSGDWRKSDVTKKSAAMAGSYRNISEMIGNRLKNGPSQEGVTDLSIIVAYMKMIDPGSVVREGEVDVLKKAEDMPATARREFMRLTGGSANMLTDNQVKEIQLRSKDMMASQIKAQQAFDEGEIQYAARLGLEPEDVITTDFERMSGINEKPGAGGASTSSMSAKSGMPQPGQRVMYQGKPYTVGEDGDTLIPVE